MEIVKIQRVDIWEKTLKVFRENGDVQVCKLPQEDETDEYFSDFHGLSDCFYRFQLAKIDNGIVYLKEIPNKITYKYKIKAEYCQGINPYNDIIYIVGFDNDNNGVVKTSRYWHGGSSRAMMTLEKAKGISPYAKVEHVELNKLLCSDEDADEISYFKDGWRFTKTKIHDVEEVSTVKIDRLFYRV